MYVMLDDFHDRRGMNDQQIAQELQLRLQNELRMPVYRADGSGTTFNFVNYLGKVSPEWKTKVGEGTAVKWPTGS